MPAGEGRVAESGGHARVAPARERGADRGLRWALFVLSLTIQIPFLQRGISYFDEGSILAIADRLRHGEVLYRDRATFVAPLTYEVMRLLFDVFGASMLVARIFQAVVFSVCASLVYEILRPIAGRRAALVGAIAFLALKPLGFPAWTMVNYSQVGMMLCLTAMWLVSRYLEEHRAVWLALAALVIGLTVLTKQNLGTLIAVTVAATVIADAARGGRPLRKIVRAAAVAPLVAVPLAIAALFYASEGALGDLVNRTIFQVPSVIAQYGRIPLPGLTIWSVDSTAFTKALFPYFPSPLWLLVLQEHWELTTLPTALTIELVVRAVYYAPLFAIAWCVATIWRDWSAGVSSSAALGRLVMVTTFAAASYASMLYRADWTHLMNVYPALLLVCVVALQGTRLQARSVGVLRTAALGVWLGGGVLMAAIIVGFYSVPVETGRGRLLAPRYQAEDTARVLDHVAHLPPGERVAFLHYDPLYYFLTRREIPLAFDIVHPGYFAPGDDESTAAELRRVDEVVYNPKIVPTITTPFTSYAPRTASVLANEFVVSDVIAPSAYVLRRAVPAPRPKPLVFDLWDGFEQLRPQVKMGERVATLSPEVQSEIGRAIWLAFRVVTATIVRSDAETCFALHHTVATHEQIEATPLSDPALWRGAERDATWAGADATVRSVRFEIAVQGSAAPATVYSEERPVDAIGPPIAVSLEAFAGQSIDLRFCAAAAADERHGPTRVPVGWAEARITRLPG